MNGRTGMGAPMNDDDAIDGLLTRWARDRHVELSPDAASAAADRALAQIRAEDGRGALRAGSAGRRWMPAAIVGGSMAAALGGVLLLTPATQVAEAPAGQIAAPQTFAAAEPGSTPLSSLPQMASETQLAAIAADDFPALDSPMDDIMMSSHVFTTRPEEELIY